MQEAFGGGRFGIRMKRRSPSLVSFASLVGSGSAATVLAGGM